MPTRTKCAGFAIRRPNYPNRVRTLFTSVGNEADRVGATQPIGFPYVDSHASRALDEEPCGSGCWSSEYFPNKVEFIPHQSKGCLGEGWNYPKVITHSHPSPAQYESPLR
jgi:hypothetical protein